MSGRATPSNKMTIACQWKIFYSASQRAMVASAVSHATANACRHFLTLAQRHVRTFDPRLKADIEGFVAQLSRKLRVTSRFSLSANAFASIGRSPSKTRALSKRRCATSLRSAPSSIEARAETIA